MRESETPMAVRKAAKRAGDRRKTPSGTARRKRPDVRRPDPDAAFTPAVLVLSGGAPNGALIAGALATIYEKGKTFSTLYTSGAGALMGMIFKAPKPPMEPPEALQNLLDLGVEDEIYRVFPVGYKTFFKSGPFTKLWLSMAAAAKLPPDPNSKVRRTYNDLVDFWFALTCPTTLTYLSKGLCAHPPFLDDFVDFGVLNNRSTPGQFFMNAYCIETAAMEEFDRATATLTEDHFNAALSYPFIYPPQKIGAKHYFEGGCVDPLNLTALADHLAKGEISARTVVIMDILGPLKKMLVRVPRNLWDAYGISIMLPVVALAEKNEALFAERLRDINHDRPYQARIKVKKIEFEIPDIFGPELADWSRKNMKRCWEIGVQAALRYLSVRDNLDELPDHDKGTSEPAFSVRDDVRTAELQQGILDSLAATTRSLQDLTS
jgi:predicted acylesterase/phospholipase RssA